jgi:OOP family OmpA-OmpF porin
MIRMKFFGVVAAVAMLAGCTTYEVDRARTLEAEGVSPFNAALVAEYQELMIFEADQMYDWADAVWYAQRAIAASEGELVLPEEPGNRNLPASHVEEITAYRAELVKLLDASARTKAPELAARAQSRFDCWVEQQEENHQWDHIAACREEFLAALGNLIAAMAAMPAAPQTFVVYFDFDSDAIRADGQAAVDDAIAAGKSMGMSSFSVTGHADRAGPADYNMGLSIRRAEAVRNALAGMNVAPANVSVAGRGETEPAVPTADGVAEQRNRRAYIVLQ